MDGLENFMVVSTAKAFEQDREKTYCIFTKPRHIEKIVNFLNSKTGIQYYITSDKQEIINFAFPFDIGISYCCPYILNLDSRPFYNYHPAPLEYKGSNVYARAIKKDMTVWGVTLHKMTSEVDCGEVIQEILFDMDEPCSTNEIGTIAHAYLFKLFRQTIGIKI